MHMPAHVWRGHPLVPLRSALFCFVRQGLSLVLSSPIWLGFPYRVFSFGPRTIFQWWHRLTALSAQPSLVMFLASSSYLNQTVFLHLAFTPGFSPFLTFLLSLHLAGCWLPGFWPQGVPHSLPSLVLFSPPLSLGFTSSSFTLQFSLLILSLLSYWPFNSLLDQSCAN